MKVKNFNSYDGKDNGDDLFLNLLVGATFAIIIGLIVVVAQI